MRRWGLLLVTVVALSACPASPAQQEIVQMAGDTAPHAPTPLHAEPPAVRVRLTKPTQKGRAPILVKGNWHIEDLEGNEIHSGSHLEAELVAATVGARIGDLMLPREGAVLIPERDGDLKVGSRTYPGSLRISRSLDRRYRLHVDTDIETYLAGVVPGELPAVFPRECQRTQAIIARTYALSRARHALGSDPILLTDTGRSDQEYVGIPPVARHRQVAADAVRSTRGMVAFEGDAPVRAWYHSTCGGHTCPSSAVFDVETTPALAGIACGYCVASKYYEWTAQIPEADVVRAGNLSGALESLTITQRTAGERATRVEIRAGGLTNRVSAALLRTRVGSSKLRSTLITSIQSEGGHVVITGRGWGHGVGLCQMGAKGLAEQGSAAEEIVAHYYPGVRMVQLW